MRIGMGIHFRAKGLTPDLFTHWCFDNLGEVQTTQPDLIISGDHERGIFFSYSITLNKIRIGVFGAYTQETAAERIDQLATQLVQALRIELEGIEYDLFEEGKGKIGHWTLPLASQPIREVPVVGGNNKPPAKIRWN